MFLQRLLVAAILTPLGLWALFSGEFHFAVLMTIFFVIAVREYDNMLKVHGFEIGRYALFGMVISVNLGMVFLKEIPPLAYIVLFSFAGSIYHLMKYERGRDLALVDLGAFFTGALYLGIFGSNFVAIRLLPGGEWWVWIVLSSVFFADSGAYTFGKWIGKTPLAPRLSPKKTREGYIAGLFSAVIFAPLFLFGYHKIGWPVPSEITYLRVILIGLLMGVFTVFGDLVISMLKRYFRIKNTGKILLSHGGILDRIDSWLWGVTIGYYLINIFFTT
jgi:phosphatidate cytidylyltransferase